MASLRRASARSRSSLRRSSISAARRSAASSTGVFSRPAISRKRAAFVARVAPRRIARHRLEAAHARRHRAFGHDGDRGRYRPCGSHGCRRRARSRRSCCRPALPMETTRTSSPYFSPNRARAPDSIASSTRHQLGHDRLVLQQHRVGDVLDRCEFLVVDRLRVAEVEAQAVGRDERALLGDVIAEHLAQRLVQKMRRRMVGAHGRAARMVDDRVRATASSFSVPFSTAHVVDEEVAELLLGAGDAHPQRPRPA